MHGMPDTAATSRPADLARLVRGKLDAAAPRRGSTFAPSQSIQAVSHIGRPGNNKRAVLVEFSTHTAKHEAFKLSAQLRREGLHLADELTHKQLKAQRGLAADFSALKLRVSVPSIGVGNSCTGTRALTGHARGGRLFECLPLPAPPGRLLGPLALPLGQGSLLLLVEA